MNGLKEAIDYAKGDGTKGKITKFTVNKGKISEI